jgi:hypothetical protein
MSGPLVNDNNQTVALFQFPFIVLLHGRGAFFNLQPFVAFFNFNPHRQLHPSSPSTSIPVANFIPCLQLQPSSPFNFQTPSLFYSLPFSLKPEVCLMLLLPDELVT